jgi:hypothetical protein
MPNQPHIAVRHLITGRNAPPPPQQRPATHPNQQKVADQRLIPAPPAPSWAKKFQVP